MQNIFLPLPPLLPSFPAVDINCSCRDIWKLRRESQTVVPLTVRGSVDSPSFPGLDTQNIPRCPVKQHLVSPLTKSAGSSYSLKPLENQLLTKTSQCFIMLFYQFFPPSSKNSREPWLPILDAHWNRCAFAVESWGTLTTTNSWVPPQNFSFHFSG